MPVPTDLQKARELFLHAVGKLPPEAWEAYVGQASGDNAELRHEVMNLLKVHREAGSFLQDPAVGPSGQFAESQATATVRSDENLGAHIGPYKLLEQIGEGGFGVVYMAEQTEPVRRKVALKILKPGMDTRQIVARFEAERQALAIMDHPNIAKVFDGGSTQEPAAQARVSTESLAGAAGSGRPYFVMELVKGIPITEYCDQNHLTPRQRLELFIPVCQAVQHAHQKGIIHRDIKPTNVLVTRHDGVPVPKVIDFGIAKAMGQQLTERTLFTNFAQMVGTPLYMSPEQAEMSGLDVDTRTDVYALGVLLYELLTGTTPFEKERFKRAAYDEIRRIIREEEPLRPSTRVSTLGQDAETISASRKTDPQGLRRLFRGELDWIVMRCLEKDRNRRYESASALAADVQRYLNDEPVQACPPSALYRFRKFARRNRRALVTVTVLASAALVGTGALAASTILVWNANKGLSEALARERSAVDGERSEAYIQRITVARGELLTDVAAALKALRECPENLRGWEWHYLMRRCLMEPLVIHTNTEMLGVAFSPDGSQLASAGGDGAIKIWDSRTGQLIRKIANAHAKAACCIVFHPDRKHLASAGTDGRVKVWDVTVEPAVCVFEGPCDALRRFGVGYTVAFSPPDGRLLAAGSGGIVRVWDWAKNRPQHPEHAFPGHKNHSIPVTFSDDGRRLATGSASQGQRIWDPESGLQLGTWPAHQFPVSALAFGPSGTQLATASLDHTVKLWDTTNGKLIHEFLHTGNVLGVAFSPDGKRLVSTGEDKTVRIWDASTYREVLALRGHTDSCGCVVFSPRGHRLASASLDGTIRVWDATPLRGDEREKTTFARHETELRTVAVSPDGKSVVSAGHGGHLKIWDAKTKCPMIEIPGHTVMSFSAAWHPDGCRIASAGDGSQLSVKVWDARTGHELFMIQSKGENFAVPFLAVAFSPEGRFLVTGKQDGIVEVWDARTGKRVSRLGAHEREIRGLTFSPDGKHLASASGDGQVKLWDATRLEKEQQPRLSPLRARVPGPSLNVAFSPDSERLATGGQENTVKIWDVESGKLLQTLEGHRGEVYSVAFCPIDNGRWIASAGEDSAVKIWDSRTGTEVATFRGHTGVVTTLSFSHEGKRLYSGSRDTTVKVWDLAQLNQASER